MATKKKNTTAPARTRHWIVAAGLFFCGACAVAIYLLVIPSDSPLSYDRADAATTTQVVTKPVLNTTAYNEKLLQIAHVATSSPWYTAFMEGTTTASTTIPKPQWPVKTVYPQGGALLPFNRIVAYYGNFYSTGMGVLGEYPPSQMIPMLQAAAAQWQAADPSTPVIPAIDYIAVTAQASPGADGMYRARMPASQIQEAEDLAAQVHGIVILDVQVGLSNVEAEVPLLAPYLKLPNVELALDPEFAMQSSGKPPGTVIGTLDAKDINWAANYLAQIVNENNLPPKILVVHRFTQEMVTHADDIAPLPQVQIVMDMDGWGSPSKKIGTYEAFIASEPVQFTGFKLFYKNDLKAPSTGLMTPSQVLNLTPAPVFIQYQ